MSETLLAPADIITRVASKLEEHNIESIIVADKEEALEKIKELIPEGASVINGASTTLEEIGYIAYLKEGTHGWKNLQENVVAETDLAKQSLLRKQASIADYYLGSVHALTEGGELVIASATGSQLPSVAFNSANLIFVVGAQKIVPDLAEAFKRIEEHVIPLEDARMQKAYGMGTMLAKTLIFHREHPMMGRKVRVIFVNESLGF